ncbi:tetratricopeptide repeat protein [Kluyvera ascorbata]|uniref:tetratricopeptide repeat protein n=1 Tax=Kluyvera ascorbata TaxID=51288 RepID=UPI0034D3EF52
MPAVQPNTSKIEAILSESLEAGKLLVSDIEKQKLLREVRALPIKYQSLALEGLIVLLDGQFERGIDAIEQSLKLYPLDPVTWGNYSNALSNIGLYSREREVLIRSLEYEFPAMAYHTFHFGAFWVDAELMKMGYDKLERYDQLETITDSTQIDVMRMIEFIGEDGASALKKVAEVLMSVLEDESIKAKGSNFLSDGEGYVSFSVSIDTDDPAYLSYLNDKIIDVMIERGLETGSGVAYFEAAN